MSYDNWVWIMSNAQSKQVTPLYSRTRYYYQNSNIFIVEENHAFSLIYKVFEINPHGLILDFGSRI